VLNDFVLRRDELARERTRAEPLHRRTHRIKTKLSSSVALLANSAGIDADATGNFCASLMRCINCSISPIHRTELAIHDPATMLRFMEIQTSNLRNVVMEQLLYKALVMRTKRRMTRALGNADDFERDAEFAWVCD
jgi:ribosomal protein L14